jgi:hypothetical protein
MCSYLKNVLSAFASAIQETANITVAAGIVFIKVNMAFTDKLEAFDILMLKYVMSSEPQVIEFRCCIPSFVRSGAAVVTSRMALLL